MSTWAAQANQAASRALMSRLRSSLRLGLLGGRVQATTLLQPMPVTGGAGNGRPLVQAANSSRQHRLGPAFEIVMFTFELLPLLVTAMLLGLALLPESGEAGRGGAVVLGVLLQRREGVGIAPLGLHGIGEPGL